jgi:glycosyltransferase involved in cell wall biosynthesis
MPTTISYLVTSHNEKDTLYHLLSVLFDAVKHTKDEIIIIDDFSTEQFTNDIIQDFMDLDWDYVHKYQHALGNDYSSHKNFGVEKCSGDWIFQLDGDEMLPENLIGENLHALIESNPNIEAYAIPRINDFRGVTEEHAKQWGWRLTMSKIYSRPIANFPDFQFRLFKNTPNIRFKNKLHEKIEGYKEYSFLPAEEEWALYHDKTIETQIATNLRYNRDFSKSENEGHTIK